MGKQLCNGPSKLCQAFDINKSLDREDLTSSSEIWLEEGMTDEEDRIISSTRVGIEGSGEEWSRLRLRFYIYGNQNVSVRDKELQARENGTGLVVRHGLH